MDNKLNLELTESISELRYYLKHFDVRTKRYKIFFRGKSIDFDGYRVFTPDDDMASVDWKASAKSNQLLVKQYKEEEDKKMIFILDIGESMVSGSANKLKCEYAAEIVLSLVDLMVNLNDKVGLITYNDQVKDYFPPKRGRKVFEMYLDTLSDSKRYGGGSNMSLPVDFVVQNFDNSVSSVILISDFLNFNKGLKGYLDLLASKYETMAFIIKDQIDLTLPDISGEFVVEDSKTGEKMLVDPKLARKMYEKHAKEQEDFVIESLKNSGIDYIKLTTDKPFVHDLINFLEERIKWR